MLRANDTLPGTHRWGGGVNHESAGSTHRKNAALRKRQEYKWLGRGWLVHGTGKAKTPYGMDTSMLANVVSGQWGRSRPTPCFSVKSETKTLADRGTKVAEH